MNLNIAIPKNAYGVWSVPSLNIQLPVYLKNNSTRQQIVDNKESALIDPWVNAYRICDHFCSVGLNGKGVWSMQQIMLGAEAYMTKPDGCYQYECYIIVRPFHRNYIDVECFCFSPENCPTFSLVTSILGKTALNRIYCQNFH